MVAKSVQNRHHKSGQTSKYFLGHQKIKNPCNLIPDRDACYPGDESYVGTPLMVLVSILLEWLCTCQTLPALFYLFIHEKQTPQDFLSEAFSSEASPFHLQLLQNNEAFPFHVELLQNSS